MKKEQSSVNDISNSYDDIPYTSNPFPQTHPNFLRAVCSLWDFETPKFETANILEIGCSFGGNCISIAQQYPKTHVLGLDLSKKQIALGRQAIKAVGLKNIELKHQDITTYDPPKKHFDYIICHGVYSWIPDTAKDAIFRVISEGLSEHGVAIVSYNTYPGWKIREVYRDAMRYRSQPVADVKEKIRYGFGMLDFLKDNLAKNSPWGVAIDYYYDHIRKASKSYLAHEDFEGINNPCYFHEFMQLAEARGLTFVSETDFYTHFSPPVVGMDAKAHAALKKEANGDIIKLEQLRDYLSNRQFRQTILTRKENRQKISIGKEAVSYDILSNLHIRGIFVKEQKSAGNGFEWRSINADNPKIKNTPVTNFIFNCLNGQRGQTIQVSHIWTKIEKAEMNVNKEPFFSVIFDLILLKMVHISSSAITWKIADTDKPVMHKQHRALTTWIIEHPDTMSLATAFHVPFLIGIVGKELIPFINGKHSRKELAEKLVKVALAGTISFNDANNERIGEGKNLHAVAKSHTKELLTLLENQGFLR
ncbi:MAG: methyltransferase regulatory domain-containing protein [Ostreibacterium sp.]